MNLPNKLTASRFALTVLFLVALFASFPGHETAALALFTMAPAIFPFEPPTWSVPALIVVMPV